jgi:RNA polymerase sigma-70 factor (ECF subfamily)
MKHDETGTTEEYILAFQRGEERGFTWVFKALYPALCLFANKYVHNKPIAEDIASESFLKIWTRREGFTAIAGLKSYLYKTTYHACLQWLQQAKKTVQQEPGDLPGERTEQRNYLENITWVETLREVQKAMNLLPAECKKIFTKLYIEGKTVKEAAEELMLSISTVKSQKARGLMLLRTKLFPGCLAVAICAYLFF